LNSLNDQSIETKQTQETKLTTSGLKKHTVSKEGTGQLKIEDEFVDFDRLSPEDNQWNENLYSGHGTASKAFALNT